MSNTVTRNGESVAVVRSSEREDLLLHIVNLLDKLIAIKKAKKGMVEAK